MFNLFCSYNSWRISDVGRFVFWHQYCPKFIIIIIIIIIIVIIIIYHLCPGYLKLYTLNKTII